MSERTDGPGLDRVSAQEAPQFVRQFLGAAVTAERLFLQAFEANGFQIAWHAGIERARADWLSVQHLVDDLVSRGCHKGRPKKSRAARFRAALAMINLTSACRVRFTDNSGF